MGRPATGGLLFLARRFGGGRAFYVACGGVASLQRTRRIAMPKIKTADGVNLYYEETGAGTPVIFLHEFAGDCRTWEPQMRRFSRSHRCVTFSQRGYPPSVVGHSMGAYTALHVGIRHPERCISVMAAGCGWGSLPDPAERAAMRAQAAETSKMFTE